MSTTDDLATLLAHVTRLREVEADLTRRLGRAEEELRASRALHAATIESLPFDFWARDRAGYCFSQNSTTLANWGDLLGRRPEDMDMAPEVIATWLENNRRALAGEIVRGDHEYVVRGEVRSIHNILAPIRMGDEIVGTLGVNLDITERNRAETERLEALRALREREAQLGVAAEAAGVGLWTWDEGPDVLRFSPSLLAMFDVAPDAAPMTSAAALARVHPDDRDRVAAHGARGLELGSWEDEYRIVREGGSSRWLLVRAKVVGERGRRVVVGAALDVTDKHLRDERLRQSQKLEAVGQLTAGIAHNFNNLLMGVLSYVELAARQAPRELLPLLRPAQQSAERAALLVRQLTTHAGRGRVAVRKVEAVGPLVERTLELCRTTFDRRVRLELDYEPTATARLDPGQIEQAILNLLLNARDATSDPAIASPRIEIRVDVVSAPSPELEGRTEDHVRVRVTDNGVGMDAATVSRIYEPFFTTKEIGKGTGLGLATTHAIVREHGGWIACNSAPGLGTTFSLYMPWEHYVVQPQAARVTPAIARGTETVLVVDDEPAVRGAIAEVLRAADYGVLQAASGDEALTLMQDAEIASAVALVILDVSMPGMPWREARTRLRELAPHARVLYCTGHAAEAVGDGDPVIEKPASMPRLLRAVRAVLDAPRAPPPP